MFALGRLLVTAALWAIVRTEPECNEPVSATSSALLQSRRQKRDLAEPFGPLDFLGSGTALNRSSLAAHCRPQALQAPPVPPQVAHKLEVLKTTTSRSNASCSGITLTHFAVMSSSTSCCPKESLSCGGCAEYASNSCAKCLGGFGLKDGKCTACISTVGWTNERGETCDALTAADCNDRPVNGQSSNQACCHCNGGEKSATPFTYPDVRFAVGSNVELKPVPRTAERYSLDAGCGFAAHNLTLDGAAGTITSTSPPTKPFSVQCEVTAHQAVHLVSTIKVTVAVDSMSYGAGALFFSSSVTSHPVALASNAADWKDFGMVCAPEAPWLSIASSGDVSTSASTAGGAVTEAETPQGDFVSMDGAVCVVSAQQRSADGEFQKRSTTFVALKPRPWPQLSFDTSYLEVVVGEELLPMKPKIPAGYEEGTGGLKPSSWSVNCLIDGNWGGQRAAPNWSYDTNWGVGLLGTHSILEVLPDGTITVAPGESMAQLFDEVEANSLQRKSVLLKCGVWGSFPGTQLPPVHALLFIHIKDSMCWISQNFRGSVIEERHPVLTEALCRNQCRMSKRCSHFTWGQDKCKHYRIENEGGGDVTAYAKITGCTDMGACLRLTHPHWVLAGDYCPVGFQATPADLDLSRTATMASVLDRDKVTGEWQTVGNYFSFPGPPSWCSDTQDTCGSIEMKLKCGKNPNNPLTSTPKKRCKGTPYTHDPTAGCDGWGGLTEQQCMDKCANNEKANNCPQKTCQAAAFYTSSGWCHLYDSCDGLDDVTSATTLAKETKVKFQAEIISPDGGADSFWVQMADAGSRTVWHTGSFQDWSWSTDSPEVTAPHGESVVRFWGREDGIKVRHFKISQGHENCEFVLKRQGTPNRLVVYKKESSIPQEVMYLTRTPGTGSCSAGSWLIQRASATDYVDAAQGYFELKGAEQVCLEGRLPASSTSIHLDLATLPCARPVLPEVEEDSIHPLIFDDPSTTQPDDYWLHPCDCLPQQWGTEWPADPVAVENVPPTSNGSFIPEAFSIVSGQFACPSRQLLKGAKGIHFQSEAESMEPADCEERCKDYKECAFYWAGTSHGASTCRLYEGCDSLVREFGMEGELKAMPHNISCQVANPENCWKTTLRKQFLTQTEGVSPSFTRAAAVMNRGGTRSWTSNSTGSLNSGYTYIEPFGNMSTIKLLGWSWRQRNQGIFRVAPGIATAVVQGLNPNKNYKYFIKQATPVPAHNWKLTVNHGSHMTVSQPRNNNNYHREGTVVSTPRGELVLDFEALNYPLNWEDKNPGTSSSVSSTSCPSGKKVTSCTCISENGICSGSKTDGTTCWAYGTMDVVGSTGKGISVRAQARCMKLDFAVSYNIKTSSGPSFSWLQMAENANSDDDEGDREMSLDAVGQAKEEEDEESVEADDEVEYLGEGDEEVEELKDDDEADDSSVKDPHEDEDQEDGDVPMDGHNHSMSLLEEGESSSSETQGWRRRRRRRRRRRSRRRRSRRRRSRRRRSRRRRTLPSSVSASCNSGQKVLGCTCYMDDFTEKRHVWTVKHHCKEVWKSGETCYAKGGYAQAICADIPEPAARDWRDVSGSGSYWTNKDEGPAATCPSSHTLTGCWCKSTTGRGDNCQRVWADQRTCRARTGPGRASTTHETITVYGRCAVLNAAAMVLTELKIELQEDASLMETPVIDYRKVGHLAPLSFHYMHLHQQCDSLLLMGGVGVEHCSRPSYRNPNYHPWAEKKILPSSFVHGTQLKVSCWKERFQSFRSKVKVPSETLHCVNGDWFNLAQSPELGGFTCEPCVMVAGKGYSNYQKRNEQELYFYSKMAMRVYTELGSVVETSAAAHKFCLTKDKDSANGMMLKNEQECPEILAIQLAGSSEIQERMMRLLKEGVPDNNQCLEAKQAADGVSASVIHATCDAEEAQQVISPLALPGILWSMHKMADRQSGEDLHSAFSSYCGAHGALSRLSYGQIFGGVTTGTKSLCQFAPVIKFGVFVDSTITYDKTSTNWPDWYTLLADSPILCADGEALTGFKHQPASNKFRYECSRIGGLGAQYEYFSSQVEVKAFDQNRNNFIESLKMINVDCGLNGLLSGFHFEFSEGGRWARSKYTCSKAGGAPVVMEPSTLIEPLVQGTEGVFCPKTLDAHTGRYDYENLITGDMLLFQRSGSWCVGADCSSQLGGAGPIGAAMNTHEVMNITDFDGQFEGKGVPGAGGASAADLAKKLKALKPPKRPAQPPKPSLEVFKGTMPTYSEECLNYQDLWKKIVETHKNEEQEEVTEEANLEADVGTEGAELLDYHPCEVAKNAGGIFGRLAGQSGQTAPENMMYADWNDCMQGDINRDLKAAKLDYKETAYDLVATAIQEGVKTLCSAIPGIEIAPFGAGVESEPDDICGQVVDFVRSLIDLPFGFVWAHEGYDLEFEGFNACNPYQVGFSRLFCDVHCVRDAVIRGDRSIINNLEKATKISNDNMKKMVEWSTEANRVETEYLDKKIDHSLKVQSIYLEHIAKNTEPVEPAGQLLKNTAAATKAMFREMRGYADAASFGTLSSRTAQDALQNFLRSAEHLDGGNVSSRLRQVQRFHGQVQALHDNLQLSSGALSKAKVVGRQISSEVKQLQRRIAQQERVLGVYRTRSHTAKELRKTHSDRSSLVTLDHLWWRIRDHLDSYLDVAESEVATVQRSFGVLENYETCQADLEGLLKSYAKSMAKMKKGHQKLKSTWREVSNLFGELSSVVQDSEVFGDLLFAEGCKSPMAKQTLQQASFVVEGMVFLLHRFQAAGLSSPDMGDMKASVTRIRKSYRQAKHGCAGKQVFG